MTDPDGVVQFFDYDVRYGRLAVITDGDGNFIAYTYEPYPRGNLTEQSKFTSDNSRTSRKRWSYEHPDYPGKLYREIQSDNTYREYGYDAAGNPTLVTDPNGNPTTYFYDLMDRVAIVAQRVNDPDPTDLITEYAYDLHGNLSTVTDAEDRKTAYLYDDMGRLVSTSSPDTGITTYAYDDAGNRLKKSRNGVDESYPYYAGTNSLYEISGGPNPRTFTYDANGNIISDGTLSFIYDQNNQLVEVREEREIIAAYGYNGLGERVKKRVGEVATIYHYDLEGKLIAESMADGTICKEYLYMGKVRIAMVEVGAEEDRLYHYLNDRLGSPEILTDAAGTVVWEAYPEISFPADCRISTGGYLSPPAGTPVCSCAGFEPWFAVSQQRPGVKKKWRWDCP